MYATAALTNRLFSHAKWRIFAHFEEKIHLQTTVKLRLTEVKTWCVINANWRKLQLFRYNNQKLLMIMEVHLDSPEYLSHQAHFLLHLDLINNTITLLLCYIFWKKELFIGKKGV